MKAQIKNIAIRCIASALPRQTYDLRNLAEKYGSKEVERIIKNTGISRIRVSPPELCTSDLCAYASDHIFKNSAINQRDIGGIVFVSQTPDYKLPATSVNLQHRLGLSNDIVAFDINYGCSGYIYGLYQASLLVNTGCCEKVLVCVGDVNSLLINEEDRATRMVFGDAGSATIVERGSDSIAFNIKTDGSGAKHLVVPAGGCRYPINEKSSIARVRADGNIRSDEDLFMNGIEIMKFSLREVPKTIQELMSYVGWEEEDVGFYGLHQANKFILDYLRKKMKLPKDKVPIAMGFTGNTGPASIPLALSLEHSRLTNEQKMERVILCGFGVGYSWGALTVNLSKTQIFDPVEL